MSSNYDYYRIFYYVAQYHSFTEAANVLKNSQPNITRCMNNLEEELGCALFVRSNRGVSLTPEGQKLYAHVSIAFRQLEAGEEELRQSGGGSVSIGTNDAALHLLLLDRLKLFRRQFPDVRVRISSHVTAQTIASLRNGLVDFAVVSTPLHIRRPLREIRLIPFQDILIGGPRFADLANRQQHLGDLGEYPIICLEEGTGTREFYQRLFAHHEVKLRVDLEVAALDQVLPMVISDLGLGFVPAQMAAQAIADGQVCRIPLAEPIPERHVSLVCDESRTHRGAAERLRRLLCGEEESA